jgi:hypothetical protein
VRGGEATCRARGSSHTNCTWRANGSVAARLAVVTHRPCITRSSLSANWPALARGSVGAGRSWSALMTGGSFQTVSSWPAGAAALACGAGFALEGETEVKRKCKGAHACMRAFVCTS